MKVRVAGEADLDLLVTSVEDGAEGVRVLTLGRANGGALPAWSPGAHLDLDLGGQVRQYSLCGSPGETRWRDRRATGARGPRRVRLRARPGARR